MTSYAESEPLLTDQRLERIETAVRLANPSLPDECVFFSARVAPPVGEPEGHFCMQSPHPRPLLRVEGTDFNLPPVRSVGRVLLSVWESDEKERGHFVSGSSGDPALHFYLGLARQHLETLDSLSSIST